MSFCVSWGREGNRARLRASTATCVRTAPGPAAPTVSSPSQGMWQECRTAHFTDQQTKAHKGKARLANGRAKAIPRTPDSSSLYNRIGGVWGRGCRAELGRHTAQLPQTSEEAPELGDVSLALAPTLERGLGTLSSAGSTQSHPLCVVANFRPSLVSAGTGLVTLEHHGYKVKESQ